jgi:hypothetical protein
MIQNPNETKSEKTKIQLKERISALKDLLGKQKDYDFSKAGVRIELMRTDDPFTDLKRGDLGSIELIKKNRGMEDQIWVKWDNGSDLMLLEGKDNYVEVGFIDPMS